MTHINPWLAYALGTKPKGSPPPSSQAQACPISTIKLYGPRGFSYRQGPLLKRISSTKH